MVKEITRIRNRDISNIKREKTRGRGKSMTIEVIFSDGQHENIGNTFEWMKFLDATQNQKTNYWATITSEMYGIALQEIESVKLPIAERVKALLIEARDNKIESILFM